MRITEILTEDRELDEGPLGAIGSAIGKGVGAVGKGLGAVAGGVAGFGRAVKKGYQTGRATVAGDPVPDDEAPDMRSTSAPSSKSTASGGASSTGGGSSSAATGSAPAAGGAASAGSVQPAAGAAAPAATPAQTTNVNVSAPGGSSQAAAPTSAADINKAGPKGAAPAKAQTGAAAAAIQKTAQATQGASAEKAGQTVYAQVKSQINNLDKKGKQRILQLLQKSLTQPAPAAQPAAKAAPAGPGAAPRTEPDLNAPATAAPADKTADVVPAKQKGQRKKPAAPSQAQIDADRERLMGPTSDSKINQGNPLAEMLAVKIEQQKRKMFEKDLMLGKISIYNR